MITALLLASALADPGDDCASAIALSANTTVLGNTINRAPDGSPACGTAVTGGGLWFSFMSPVDGVLTLDACSSTVIPRIAVYTDGCGSLTCVDGIDDACSGPPLEVDVDAGVTYQIVAHKDVGATGGVFSLTNTFSSAPPTVEPPIDCTGKVTPVCILVNRLVTLVNTEAGSLVLTESASKIRFRPTNLYTRLLPLYDTNVAGGCSLFGTAGGLYDLQSETWSGFDFQQFFGMQPADGTLDAQNATFVGANGIFNPKGNRFAHWNGQGKIAGSAGQADAQYLMGRWTRIAGATGIYTSVVGSCTPADYADVFEPWYGEPLP